MLSFTYEKNASEIIEMLNEGLLDKEIQEYCKELIETEENIRDIQEYFDLTFLEKDGYSIVGANIDNQQKYNNLSKLEQTLNKVFQEKIEYIYNKLLINQINTKLDILLNTIKDLEKATINNCYEIAKLKLNK